MKSTLFNPMASTLKWAMAIAALILPLSGAADVIHMKGGSKQAGVITQDVAGRSTISLRSIGGEIAIPRDKVERIERETPSASYARLGDQFLDAGKHAEAVEAYTTALETDKENAAIAGKLRQAKAGIVDAVESAKLAHDARLEKVIVQAEEIAKGGKFEEAVQALKNAEPSTDSPAQADFRKSMSRLHYAWGIDRADRQDQSGAADKFGIALKYDSSNDDARQRLIRAWEGDPTKLKEVTAFYAESKNPADQLKVADAYFKLREYDKALPIYVQYSNDPDVGSENIRERLRLIFDVLHEQYARQGDYARALETYRHLLEYAPNSDTSPMVKYEYMVRRSQTDLNDPKARVGLAKFAEEIGLSATAREEYENVLKLAPENAEATEGLKRFASADLADAQEFFYQAQYLLAVQKAQEVARAYPSFTDIVKQANELQTKAQIEEQRAAKTRLQQAGALALRGDDYYNQGMSYYSSYVSTNVDKQAIVFSPRNEAAKYFRQAIFAWQTALSIDPSLGTPTSYNLYWKIGDANAKYAVLANRAPPRMPKRDLDRMSRGETSVGSK